MQDNRIAGLSVIIPTYNRYGVLFDTLRLLSQQSLKPLEIIVIDQTTPSAQAKHLKEAISMEVPYLRFIDSAFPNASIARNRGIREARSDLLLFLDDDVVMPVDLLEKHFSNYSDQKIAAVSGQVLENGEKPTEEFSRSYYLKHTGWTYFPLNYSRRCEVINLNSCNLSIRKEIIIEAGGFDENYIRTFFDDTDLALRVHRVCLKKGLKAVHDPQATLIHLRSAGGNRPAGLNEYIIADRYAWMVWLYFLIINFGLYSYQEILRRLRYAVFRRVNFLKPRYLVMALAEFLLGFSLALKAIKRGRRLGFLHDDER
ncbi:MAG TPA: glycosyltransferase [Candidatus Margulisiibacteriota bacterium]|nr:glycosyltransferase [Candidatus Margulisiibacteriota bacterium]